jgi:hypothetical protein
MHDIAKMVYNPATGVGYVFIANLLASAITLLLMIPELRFSKKDYDRELLGKMILYSIPLLIAGLAGMVNENTRQDHGEIPGSGFRNCNGSNWVFMVPVISFPYL